MEYFFVFDNLLPTYPLSFLEMHIFNENLLRGFHAAGINVKALLTDLNDPEETINKLFEVIESGDLDQLKRTFPNKFDAL